MLLPTPPLPDATAIMFATPGSTSPWGSCGDAEAAARPRVFEVIVTATSVTPGSAATRSRAAFSNSAFTGHAGVVSSIVERDPRAVDAQLLDEAELDDAAPEIGIDDRSQRLENILLGDGCHAAQSSLSR